MQMKNLKYVLVILIVLLVVSFVVLSKLNTSSYVEQKPVGINENVTDVINNGGTVLQYNGVLYYVSYINSEDGYKSIVRKRIVNQSAETDVVFNEQYTINNRIRIFGNKLFFCVAGNTKWLSIDSGKVVGFCDGVLDYIDDGVAYFSNTSGIYVADYYPATFKIKEVSTLFYGNNSYLGENEKFVFYTGDVANGGELVLAINKEDSEVKQLLKMNRYQDLDLVSFGEDFIYISYFDNDSKNYGIKRANLNSEDNMQFNLGLVKVLGMQVYKNDLYFVNSDKKINKIAYNKNEITEAELPSKANAIYTLDYNDFVLKLFKNGEFFATINTDVFSEPERVSIEEVSGKVYIKFDTVNSKNDNKQRLVYCVSSDGKTVELFNNEI